MKCSNCERLERKVAAYENMERLMAEVERAFQGTPPGNGDVLAAAQAIVRGADETTPCPHRVSDTMTTEERGVWKCKCGAILDDRAAAKTEGGRS